MCDWSPAAAGRGLCGLLVECTRREVEIEMEGGKEAEEEWKVVRARKGKPPARRLSHRSAGEGRLACCPGHGPDSSLSSGDADEEPRMRGRLQKSMERVRTSVFFTKLVEQMQELQILEKLLAGARGARSLHLDRAVAKEDFAPGPSAGPADHEASTVQISDGRFLVESGEDEATEKLVEKGKRGTQSPTAVELVVLGVGSILDSEVSRCQMSLALLLKERFPCIGDVLVYDPVLSAMECGFLANLGCTPIIRDEKGRRRAYCPTLFYMPHCGASLYNNVLEENLDPCCLGWISILGNSFQRYQDSWSVFPKPKHARPDCLLGMQQHVTEHPVNAASFPCVSAFNDMSWHLFPTEKIL